MTLTPEVLAELRRLDKAATLTRPYELARFTHGGGRLFLRAMTPQENDQLLVDFYEEPHRELVTLLLNHRSDLLSAARMADVLCEEVEAFRYLFRVTEDAKTMADVRAAFGRCTAARAAVDARRLIGSATDAARGGGE